MVSQSDVIKLLWNNRAVFGPVLGSTIEALEMDDGACLTVGGVWVGPPSRPFFWSAGPPGGWGGVGGGGEGGHAQGIGAEFGHGSLPCPNSAPIPLESDTLSRTKLCEVGWLEAWVLFCRGPARPLLFGTFQDWM